MLLVANWEVKGNLRFPLDKTYHGCAWNSLTPYPEIQGTITLNNERFAVGRVTLRVEPRIKSRWTDGNKLRMD